MNRYILIRRLRGPAFLLLVGVNALLAQAHIIGWSRSWPFYLILAGLLALAERAALAVDGDVPPPPPFAGAPFTGQPYSGQPYPGQPYSGQPTAGAPAYGTSAAQPTAESTSIVPAHSHDFDDEINGGRQ
jgi:hypothetical protein